MDVQISKTKFRIWMLVIGCAALVGVSKHGLQWISTSAASSKQVTVRATSERNSYVKLQDGRELHSLYKGASDSVAQPDPTNLDSTQPLAMGEGDFNADGYPDLVCGYATTSGGKLSLHIGDPEAFSPQNPETLKGIGNRVFPDPFINEALTLDLPVAPDFLAIGDFNRDGRIDIIAAARGGDSLCLLAGDGKGGFSTPQQIALPGGVTALVAGDINQADGAVDIVMGITSASGPALVIYEGTQSILETTLSVRPLPAEVSSLAIGRLDDDRFTDVAILAGGQVLILHGADPSGVRMAGDDLRAGEVETLSLPFLVDALALGEFIWDRDSRTEMAVADAGGALHILARGELDTRPFTQQEMFAKRLDLQRIRQAAERATRIGDAALRTSSRVSDKRMDWSVVEEVQASPSRSLGVESTPSDGDSSHRILLSTRISALPSDDLLMMTPADRKLEIIYRDAGKRSKDELAAQSNPRSEVTLDLASEPVAVLPMRLNVDGRPGLVIMSKGHGSPSLVMPMSGMTFNVTKNADTNDGACTLADCSLREAIIAANANPGADMITFSAGVNPTLSISSGGGFENNAADGDLDINDSVTIVGNGAANTVISTSYTSACGDCKVFGVNQDGIYPDLTVSFSGVTIQNGLNNGAGFAGTFFDTGGGIDFFLVGTSNSHSITNCVVTNNTVTGSFLSHGGGVNVDSFNAATPGGPSAGTVTLTNCTISNNTAQEFGGGIGLSADIHDVTLTNCTVTGNAATNQDGGGIRILHSFGGTVIISGGSVSSNSGNQGGGISIVGNQVTNISSITISNNTATGTGGSSEGGGILIGTLGAAGVTGSTSVNGATISTNHANNGVAAAGGGVFFGGFYPGTVTNSTISGNTTSSGGGLFVDSIGALNVSLSRIVGNTATTGSGITQVAGSATVENNWWGCDGFPNAAGCQTGTGTFDADPRIDLRLLPASATLAPGASQTFTADVSQNSNGVSINPVVLNGLTITFGNTAGLGSVSPPTATLSSLTASTTFTANATCPSPNTGTVSATLDNGTQTSSVTVQQAPAISACPANITANTDAGQCSAAVTFTAPTATAGCPTPTVTCNPASGSSFPKGTTTVTCTASNGVAPDATCSFTVTVNDNQAPTITCPANVTQSTDPNQCSAVVNYSNATATDNCSGVGTPTCTPSSGSTFPKGPTTVNCTVSDSSSNSANCSFTVTVNDTQSPTIGPCPSSVITNTAPGLCSAVVTFATPSGSDNCPGVTVACNPPSGTAFPKGTTTVTCTATDTSSNTASCSFTVTVIDNQPPSITCPGNVNTTEDSPGSGCATVTYTTPTPSDNCPGATASCSPPSGTCFPIGTTTVTCTAMDTSGNTSSCQFTVTVTAIGLTSLSPAKLWIGLKNSDDVGTKFDLLAEVLRNGSVVGSGQLNDVPGGSSGFNNAVLRTITLILSSAVPMGPGDTMSFRLSVRIAATSGHNSGTVRLWYNGAAIDSGPSRDAGSRFDATIGGSTSDYFLRSPGFTLNTTAGSSRVSVDKLASNSGGNPWQVVGTWSKTF